MADVTNLLGDALHRFVKNRVQATLVPAKVIAIDNEAMTIDVDDMDGNRLYDVRLRAAIDSQLLGLLVYPKIGSTVVIGNIGDSPNAWVMLASTKLEQWRVLATVGEDTTEVTVGQNGIYMARGTSEVILTAGMAKMKHGTKQVVMDDNSITLASGPNTHIILNDNNASLAAGSCLVDIGTGIGMSAGGDSLRDVLDELLIQLQLLTVVVGGVPSTVPVNVAALAAVQARVLALLN